MEGSMRTTKSFIITFIISSLAALLLVAGVVVFIDPFFHYHKPLKSFPYVVDDQVDMNPGLARHMDYDSILLGSSMTVNFNTDWFESYMGLKTQKLTYNGAYPKDQSNIMDIVFDAKGNTVKRVFLGIDEMNYSGGVDETKFPITEHLYDKNPLNDVKYIFNKDVVLNYCLKPLVDRSDATQWNLIYPFWWQDEHYSKALVLMFYEPCQTVAVPPEVHSFDAAIEANLSTNIIPYIEAHPETTFTCFYPPYSILYWNDVNNRKELDTVIQKYRYMTRRLLEYDNVEVCFFQNNEDVICNLNNYADYTHYHGRICEYMVQCFENGEHRVTEDNLEEELEMLRVLAADYDYEAIWDDWYN